MKRKPAIFFGTGTGRCGTMLLANLLNSEPGVVTLHEGKFRHEEEAGEQVLPFLTLQNFHAYCQPETAVDILRKTRAETVPRVAAELDASVLGDIAYNYACFVKALPSVFPEAKLLFIHRDGRDFVRSAYTAEVPDPTPVGWLDEGRPQTRVERYIALGRLRPCPGDPLEVDWPALTPVAKNAWLWAETNRLILEGLEAWSPGSVLTVRFEDLVADLTGQYAAIKRFLGLQETHSDAFTELTRRPINLRKAHVLPPWREWDADVTESFWEFAGEMMRKLGYG